MKKPQIIDKLDQLFSNFDKVDLNSLDSFLKEILNLFSYLQEKLQSPNEDERKEALELAEQLQTKLTSLTQKAYAASGLSKEKIDELLANPANFKPQDWSSIKKLESQMTHFQQNHIKP
jgi:hypothetical protein